MHARVLTMEAPADAIDRVVETLRDAIYPAAEAQRGFDSLMALVDRDAGTVLAITFWESLADLEASERDGYARLEEDRLRPLLAGEPERAVFEVAVPVGDTTARWARVTTLDVLPGKTDDVARIARDQIAWAAQQMPGYRGFLLLADEENGEALEITLWESEDALRSGEGRTFYQDHFAKLDGLLASEPGHETFEVAMIVP